MIDPAGIGAAPTRWASIVGARPQFVKVAPICRALEEAPGGRGIDHVVVHTGQHYDAEMSAVFFADLGIPAPLVNLGVGSGSHGAQTGEILARLETVLLEYRPDWVIVYGDTNSTLAGAVAAAKIPEVRLAHVEAGLRSFNRSMPEEVNRIAADHLSHLLLCPTPTAMSNLRREGLESRAVLVGDVMFDSFLAARVAAERQQGGVASRWPDGGFALASIHRQENTDNRARLHEILQGLEEIAESICPVILPLHPRTRRVLEEERWTNSRLGVTAPLSYHEMLLLVTRARMILTDSGGVQKEAYFARRPCITLRDETEWIETLEHGCNVLVGADRRRIVEAARATAEQLKWTAVYGDGHAGRAVIDAILAASTQGR